MKFQQLQLNLPQKDVENVSELLTRAGALAIDLQDAGEEPLFAEQLDQIPLWQEIKLTALFDKTTDLNAILSLMILQLAPGTITHTHIESLAEEDWLTRCQQQFQPIQVTEDLWIVPSWLEPPDSNAANAMLNPGLAFGTGEHPTTQLCLQWLATHIQDGETVIDYGCGSGILAIAALKLGAQKVYCVDNDPQALEAASANIMLNKLANYKFAVHLPEQLPTVQADIVIANILLNPLITLAPTFASIIKQNSKLVLSGVLATQKNQLLTQYKHYHFQPEQICEKNGWLCISFSPQLV